MCLCAYVARTSSLVYLSCVSASLSCCLHAWSEFPIVDLIFSLLVSRFCTHVPLCHLPPPPLSSCCKLASHGWLVALLVVCRDQPDAAGMPKPMPNHSHAQAQARAPILQCPHAQAPMAALQTGEKCSHTKVYAPLFRHSAPCPERLSTILRGILTRNL